MIKKKSFTVQTAPENRVGRWAKFLEWNRKWNKIMAGVFCVLVFALLFAAVMVNTTTTNNAKQLSTRNGDVKNLSPRNAGGAANSCEFFPIKNTTGNMCDILCTCTKSDSLSQEVEAAIENDDSNCSSIGYHLRYDEPQTSAIKPGWFKTSAFINKITIKDMGQDGLLKEIEPGSFDDCTFRKMTELVIKWTAVSVLKKGVFDGASSLKKLTFDENDFMCKIEASALDPLYQLEEIKMVKQPQFDNLFNLTGYTQLKHVHKLTLNFNNFTTSIDAETFRGCIGVESINLSNSSIETIGPGTFDHMAATIRFLDLRNNKLKRLPGLLLEPLLQSDVEIFLSSNPWHCDCGVLELQSWSSGDYGVIADCPLVCDMPPLENGNNITDVDLSSCEKTTTVGYDTTIESWPTTPFTQQPPLFEPVNCVNDKHYPSGTLYLKSVYQYFNIKQVEMGTVSIETSEPDHDSSLSMVIVNDKDDVSCRYDVNRQMTFNNLDPNAAHLFCLIKKASDSTSPRNCYPFHFDDPKSIWGHDEIIIALICSIVLSLVVGLLCGWLLSRRYQRVFKAKEPLQYRSSGRTSSKTATEIEDFNSSITSDYFAGRYGSVNRANSKRLRRTYSDNSIASGKSYITAVTPSPFEIIQWKLRKNAIQSNDLYLRDYLEKVEYDCLPPPLPPHPNRRDSEKIYETIAGEPVYVCTGEIDPYKITYATSS